MARCCSRPVRSTTPWRFSAADRLLLFERLDFVGPAIVLDDVVNIAADSKVVYLVTGQVDSELCRPTLHRVDLVNTAR